MSNGISNNGSAVTSGASTAEAPSPLPFSVHDRGVTIDIRDANNHPIAEFWMTGKEKETAALICRAVNSHDALVSALSYLVQQIEDFGYVGRRPLEEARAALAKVQQ
jgi:hypothetical protein